MDRFIKEAEILMTLRHPHITPIYGVGEHDGRPYILMEYFEGFNLSQAKDALALGHAHRQDIVHRDIKPSNLLTRKGDARVVDFGIAQIMDPDGERFTQTGATPVGDAFAAPELVDNPRLLDPRCDIYSLGACWFWLLTGTTPRGRSWEGALRALDQMNHSYENVLLKTLDQAEKRYQTAEQLVQDIRALRTGSDPEANLSGELDDDAALLLGVIFEQFVPDSDPTSTYRLEQELAGRLNRFAFSMSLRTLRRHEYVESVTVESDRNYDTWQGLVLTDTGEVWVEANRIRVAKLIEQVSAPTPGELEIGISDDDIPF